MQSSRDKIHEIEGETDAINASDFQGGMLLR
jgi:hypothetical protein